MIEEFRANTRRRQTRDFIFAMIVIVSILALFCFIVSLTD